MEEGPGGREEGREGAHKLRKTTPPPLSDGWLRAIRKLKRSSSIGYSADRQTHRPDHCSTWAAEVVGRDPVACAIAAANCRVSQSHRARLECT